MPHTVQESSAFQELITGLNLSRSVILKALAALAFMNEATIGYNLDLHDTTINHQYIYICVSSTSVGTLE